MAEQKKKTIAESEKESHKQKMSARAARESQLRKDKKLPKSAKPDEAPKAKAHKTVEGDNDSSRTAKKAQSPSKKKAKAAKE